MTQNEYKQLRAAIMCMDVGAKSIFGESVRIKRDDMLVLLAAFIDDIPPILSTDFGGKPGQEFNFKSMKWQDTEE